MFKQPDTKIKRQFAFGLIFSLILTLGFSFASAEQTAEELAAAKTANEKKLQQFYNKYINKPIYRAIPLVDYNEIKNNGIDPTKNPYNKIKPSMKKLANIILKLEKEGY